MESEWCDQEVGYCMARGVLIVPVSISADPHGFIGKYQRMNASLERNAMFAASQLFSVLASSGTIAEKMVEPIGRRYAASYSFDDARENLDRLKTIPGERWTPKLAEIVTDAPSANNQIEHAGTNDGEPMPEAALAFLEELRGQGADVGTG
jgi:hypothetical protein